MLLTLEKSSKAVIEEDDFDEFVAMEEAASVIFERTPTKGRCPCWDSVYNNANPSCVICDGTGTLIGEREGKLALAVVKKNASLLDDDDPVAFVYTYYDGVVIGDVVVSRGSRYEVTSVSEVETLGKKKVWRCEVKDARTDY